MTLDEAIIHSEEKAEELRTEAEQLRDIGEVMSNPKQPYNEPVKNCLECANEHEQLAKWLKELKILRKAYDLACKNSLACWDCEGQIDCSDKSCVECFKEYYLQKARESNENT